MNGYYTINTLFRGKSGKLWMYQHRTETRWGRAHEQARTLHEALPHRCVVVRGPDGQPISKYGEVPPGRVAYDWRQPPERGVSNGNQS